MRERYHVRSCSRSRTPKRCSAEGVTNEFILVDDDDDVIIIDFPESSKLKSSDASRNQSEPPSPRVISIDDGDDDDDHDHDPDNVHTPGNSADGVSENTGRDDPNRQTSTEVDDDDCQVIQEKCSAFIFSRCKQTFSKKAPSRNRFGLGSESEGGLSDSDCSDCEVLEGSSSKVREPWEKAFLRKRHKAGKVSSDLSEEASHFDIPCDTNPGIGVKNKTEKDAQPSSFFSSRNSEAGKEKSSLFPNGDGDFHATSFGSEMDEDNWANNWANSSFCNEENSQGPSSQPDETPVDHGGSSSPPPGTTSSKGSMHQTWFNEVEEEPEEVHVRHEMSASPLFEKNQTKEAAHLSGTKEAGEEVATEPLSPLAQPFHGDRDTMSVPGTQGEEVRIENDIPCLSETGEPIFHSAPSTSGQVHDYLGTPSEIDIMLGREKLKETDEYKRAAEEEWESRQRQLQIQAEEAQRQRKRIKLESMRRIEMERRQKERVEEMRETQKKDEESMNMKEKVRAEVCKSLKRLEITCFNMASLLRGLGIPVGGRGGSFPLPHEVHVAYKRALLKFHPDRARGDLRQQVEAEEKFKLIARMKDKFQSSSFR
ncbi:PREDICTED: protein IWS1 homolog A [Tarenaya hassleriana]|uniref:protein IWS1 homolog A n=1 Tax=Tarenaya hassleriana TaxID=28532 RepID=UPI00053C28FD|nr:PREDICTED: protein IWS1 homolog A [Tarenaya hassleriana]XP_010551355.1 PREDICTED: protein IWS1 homolog A [Tarenaya hassleriana]XP_010551356.1 PREDICTED: protein IWS1 homolog A [Tarenaya hassleriana]